MRLQELIEALNKQQYKQLMQDVGAFDANRYEDIFKKYPRKGKNPYRIYLNADSVDLSNNEEIKGRIQRDVETVLSNHGYEIVDYAGNKARKESDGDDNTQFDDSKLSPEQIKKRQERQAKPKKEQLFKIGKLLQQFDVAVYKEYVADNQTKKGASHRGKELLVCISRHPYDVGGMSTGQSWTSCMNLEGGVNAHYVSADIKGGALVAYLISKDDLNLQKPLARTLILPYISQMPGEEFVFGVSKAVYPPEMADVGFSQIVVNWANEVNDSKELQSWVYRLADVHYGEVHSKDAFRVGKRDLKDISAYHLYKLYTENVISFDDIPDEKLSQDFMGHIIQRDPSKFPILLKKGLEVDKDILNYAVLDWNNFNALDKNSPEFKMAEPYFAANNIWKYVDWIIDGGEYNEEAILFALGRNSRSVQAISYLYRQSQHKPSKEIMHAMVKTQDGYEELQSIYSDENIDESIKRDALVWDTKNITLMKQTKELVTLALNIAPSSWKYVTDKTPELEQIAEKIMKEKLIEKPLLFSSLYEIGFIPDEETQLKMVEKNPKIIQILVDRLRDGVSEKVRNAAERQGAFHSWHGVN